MKKIFPRLISILCVFALFVGMFSTAAFASEAHSEFITLEVATDTTIREKASQNSNILSNVKKDGYLLCTGSTTNKWGNVWYRVIDISSGKEGFIFSGKVKNHSCKYHPVDDSNLFFCACGTIKQENSGMMHTGYAAALPVITPDVLATLAGTGTAICTSAAAAIPYVAIGVAFGALVYVLVNVASNSVTVEKVHTDWKKLDKNFKPDEGLYYHGTAKNNFFFVDISHPMDGYEAMDAMEAGIFANRFATLLNEKYHWFIYTVTDFSALCLAEDFVAEHSQYSCRYVEDTHGSSDSMYQLQHYHIYPRVDPRLHLGGHIMFGAPQHGTFNDGAWA